MTKKYRKTRGSGLGTVGRVVSSDTSDPRIHYQHRQKFIHLSVKCIKTKRQNKEKVAGKAHFLKDRKTEGIKP